MKVISIKDMIRKDVPIYYRRLYTGVAVIEFSNNTSDIRIDFSIETKPTGEKEITVTLLDSSDFPLIPLTKLLKSYIAELDDVCGLPE